MASSRTRPNYARRFFWLAVLIVLAIAAYSAGWYYLAQQIDARAASAIAAINRGGAEAVCANRSVRGYPFRIGLYCDDVTFTNAAEGTAFSAGEFRSAGQIYDPRFLIGELDGPARLETEPLPPLDLGWEIMRASVRLASPLPERVSLEGREVTAATPDAPVLTLENIEAHMRPSGTDLDLAWSFQGLQFEPALTQGRALPPFAGDADIALEDGASLAVSSERSLRGQSGTIRNMRLIAGDASISLSGPFAVDGDGLVDAELELSVENPQELSALLGDALPEFADQIETAFTALGAMPALPVTISRSRVSVAFLDVGEIPPL